VQSRFGGDWALHLYVNTIEYAEHVALVKGEVSRGGPVPVRMHAMDVLSDVLGVTRPGSPDLHAAMEMIAAEGRGVVVLIREPRRTSLSERVRRLSAAERTPPDLRDYGVGAQILTDLGVTEMVLLTNSQRAIVGLEGYGLSVVERRKLP
jgi:3,4-dihydroxy 2-butanone 4-phosphate synthase/GTP cyclohydrolase II